MSDKPTVNSNVEGEETQESVQKSLDVEKPSGESDGDSSGRKPSESDLAKALSSLISSLITDFDSRAEQTIRSQDQLSLSIDRLTRELDQLLEDAPLPFIMQHATKITGVRKRVLALNSVLKSVQRRLDNIDQTVSAGLSHEKVGVDGKAHGETGITVGLIRIQRSQPMEIRGITNKYIETAVDDLEEGFRLRVME